MFLLRTETGCQVLGRQGGADGLEVAHYFDDEDDARATLQRMRDTTPAELSNWAKMSPPSARRTAQAGAVAAILRRLRLKTRIVVCGDMNDDPAAATLGALTPAGLREHIQHATTIAGGPEH